MRKNIIFYVVALGLLAASYLFFNNAYREITLYTKLTERSNNVFSQFQNLSKQVNNASVIHPDLLRVNEVSTGEKLFFTDSQTVYIDFEKLKRTVKDSVNIRIVEQLGQLLNSELSWIIKSNVPDSIINRTGLLHIQKLKSIDSLINAGLSRTTFLLSFHKTALNNAIRKEKKLMIVFLSLTTLFILYTTFSLTRQKSKTKRKEDELETVFNRINDGVISLNSDWRYTFLNDAALVTHPMGKEKTLGRLLWEVHPEIKSSIFWNKYNEAVETKKVVEIESYYSPLKTWFSVKVYPSQDGLTIFFEDITERKNTATKLKAADQQLTLFASIINSSEDGIISKTLDGIITTWNRGAENIFGYTESEAIGKSIYMIIPPDLAGEEENIILKIRNGAFIKHYETERLRKDGRRISISLTVSPVHDTNGAIAGVSKIVRDITEKKKAEEAIQYINEEKNMILESIDDAFFAVDKNWIVTYWNSRAEIMVQMNKVDIVGHNLWDKFPDSIGNEAYKKYHHAIAAHEVVRFESLNATFKKWYEISAYPSGLGLSVYFKDITARKESEILLTGLNENLQKQTQQLSRSNKELEQLAMQLSSTVKEVTDYKFALDEASIVAITDQKGIIKYVNENFCKISKYSSNELIGQDHRIINSGYHSKDFIKELWTTIANGNIWKGELRNKAKDGTTYWVDTTIVPFLDNNKKPYQYVAIRSDITERKTFESNLIELNNNLKKQATELSRSNSELEQFAYVASHDMQEPLRMVSSFLTQLEKKYSGIIDETGKTYIEFAVDGAKRMRQIILDLLEFSRVGKTDGKLEEVNINDLIKEIEILFRVQIEDTNATIVIADLPVIITYRTPLRQVFQNIIGNALKYAHKEVPVKINISCSNTLTHWEFSIADNGIGIAEEYFEKIFVIFQRLHNKDEYSGTGMGLAVTKKIIENMGGKIWVYSEEGKGSIFNFSILKNNL